MLGEGRKGVENRNRNSDTDELNLKNFQCRISIGMYQEERKSMQSDIFLSYRYISNIC